MKVQVDFDRCQSDALCEALAPDTFEIDADDFLQILDEEVTDANRDQVEAACDACPTQAISLIEG